MPVFTVEYGYQYAGSSSIFRRQTFVEVPWGLEGGKCSESRALREVREKLRGDSSIDLSSVYIYDIRE